MKKLSERIDQKTWNIVFLISFTLSVVSLTGVLYLFTDYGKNARSMPLTWILMVIFTLGAILAHVSYNYVTAWRNWKIISYLSDSPYFFGFILISISILLLILREVIRWLS